MSNFEFSLTGSQTRFHWTSPELAIVSPAGHTRLLAGISEAGQLTAWGLETLIYRTEEIIESDKRVRKVEGAATSNDQTLAELSQRYFGGNTEITDVEIETVFNRLADEVSYSAQRLEPAVLQQIAYLVFIREMAHHLHVTAFQARMPAAVD